MSAEEGRSPSIDAYGWPQSESAALSDELRIIQSILPAIDLAGLQLAPLATGQEHMVFTSSLATFADRVVKVTRPGGYGIVMEAKSGDSLIGWRRGTPREYLQRLHRQKRVLSDSVEILGTTLMENEHGAFFPSIVTAQKFRAGIPPSIEEIHAYMTGLGFSSVPGRAILLEDLQEFSFYSSEHNLLVSDCRSANFVKAEGGLAVIDVIVQRPVGHLRQLLRRSLGIKLNAEQVKEGLDQIISHVAPGRNRSLQAAQRIVELGARFQV